ncbi:hypothetical protein OIV83_004338 [Microbotryomycetes sp. JL201]|nr:hypothetical protein OIV83_004287 [Microbotryomycetes sp. JL201]KAK4049189.1 hypothetical protein OIV83_004338 [Microbotryomycetes sp. JL201]
MTPSPGCHGQVLATSLFPYTPLSSAQPTVGYSQDGQLFVLTRGEINVFTPALGIQVDKPPNIVEKAPSHATKAADVDSQPDLARRVDPVDRERMIPLFRSILPIEKKEIVLWAEWVNEMQVATPGMAEPFWQSASWSPSGIGLLGGCVLATLTNNCEVLLFEPSKNSHKGEWSETYDLTSHLIRIALPDENFAENRVYTLQERLVVVARVLECQAMSVAWSEAVHDAHGDWSILAVGYRSGHIALWRRNSRGMEIMQRHRVDEKAGSIVNVAWSRWHIVQSAEDRRLAVALLAVGDAQGNVWSIEVSQDVPFSHTLLTVDASKNPAQGPAAAGVSTLNPRLLCRPDSRPVTRLLWFGAELQPRLAYTKLGVVNIVTMSSTDEGASNFEMNSNEQIELETERIWMGSSAYATCSGLALSAARDQLWVALEEGSIHVIALGERPRLIRTEDGAESTRLLSERALSIFEQSRPASSAVKADQNMTNARIREGPCVGGFADLQAGEIVAWHYSVARPTSILYQTNASTASILVVAQLATTSSGSNALRSSVDSILSELSGSAKDHAAVARRVLLPLHILNQDIANRETVDFICSLSDAMELDVPAAAQDPIKSPESVAAAFCDVLMRDATIEHLRVRETLICSATLIWRKIANIRF